MAKRAQKTQAQTQAQTKAQKPEKPAIIELSAGAVSNIAERWSDDNSVLFDCMIYDNIWLYGLTLRYNDKGEPWVSFPARQGKDGKYYKHYYCVFSADAIKKIEDTLYPEE